MRISDWSSDVCSSDLTRVYIAQNSGRIVAVRNGTWRLYDFFWGLHIMDWKNHEDFNTPWLIGFAGGGLALDRGFCSFVFPLAAKAAPQELNDHGGFLGGRSEEHTSELQSLMRISYSVFCLKKKTNLQSYFNTLIY